MLACLAVFGAVGPANAAPGDMVKVFVVGDRPVTLPAIAGSTLGDPGRAGEIFDLNRGRRQPDGTALTGPGDQLRPGWILRLPADASGPDVQQAREGATTGTTVTVSLPAVLAVIVAVLLALVTAAILGRRRVGRWFKLVGRLFHALGEPARRRRQLARRQSLGARLAADEGSLRRAYDAVGEVAAMRGPVHAVRADPARTTVWLSATDALTEPWQQLDSTRWRRPAGAAASSAGSRMEQAVACLVRAGADDDGEPVFVDLSLLDGVLSVTGDRRVARDLVAHLLTEIARVRPNLPVAVLNTADAGLPLTIPAGLAAVPQVPVPAYVGRPAGSSPLRGAAARHPVRGLIVTTGTPDEREAADLVALCGTDAAGWTGLVAGDVPDGAHWRWQAHADGSVDIPVLGVRLTVPA